MPSYSGSYTSGEFDRWLGLELYQPAAPSAYRTGVADAAYFGKQVMDNVLALIKGSVGSPWYGQVFACASGLTTGQPVYLSDADTVALAAASGASTSKVIGFVRDKTSASTGCYVSHFWRATGLTCATGSAIYLTNAGGFSTTGGTVSCILGIGTSTTGAVLSTDPYRAAEYVFARSLDSGIAKEIVTATISGSAESGDYRAVTVALKDAAGVATGSRCLVEAWLSDTGYGWETATAPTGFVVASGTTGDTPTANKRVRGVSLSDGTLTFTVQTDAVRTYVFHASVRGKVYTLTLAFA